MIHAGEQDLKCFPNLYLLKIYIILPYPEILTSEILLVIMHYAKVGNQFLENIFLQNSLNFFQELKNSLKEFL